MGTAAGSVGELLAKGDVSLIKMQLEKGNYAMDLGASKGNSGPVANDGRSAVPISAMDERTVHVLTTVRAILRTMLRAKDEAELLHQLCSDIISEGCFRHAGIAFAKDDGAQRIHWAAWVGEDETAAASVDLMQLNEAGLGWDEEGAACTAVGVSLQTRKPCLHYPVTGSGAMSAKTRYLRSCAQKGRFATMSALPMMDGENLLGALFVAAPKPGVIEEESISFLMALADDLAHGILALRLRERHDAAVRTIERLAFHDSLTGLPNRTRYLVLLQESLERVSPPQINFALLHVKLTRLAEIGEVLGHTAAEHLVAQFAGRLRNIAQPGPPLARIADGSFALLLSGWGAVMAESFAHHLAGKLREPVEIGGIMIEAPVQIGIAVPTQPVPSALELDRQAEAALQHGKGSVRLYVPAKDMENAAVLALVSDLQRAIHQNGLRLYCQPKIEMGSGRIAGAEVLVRWNHPVHGDIPPAHFVKLAERSDMISQLTGWILHAALEQMHVWQQAGFRCPLAINLCAHDLNNPALLQKIEDLILTWALDPGLIQFELTESVLIEDPEAARQTLERLKQLGVELAIDDFGTGFSGLSYLQSFPVDCIKIDQSFIMPMLTNASSAAIVRSTIALGHQLGLRIIAEGVEDTAVWRELREQDCDVAQGYLISRPMPISVFRVWAERWSGSRDANALVRMGVPASGLATSPGEWSVPCQRGPQ